MRTAFFTLLSTLVATPALAGIFWGNPNVAVLEAPGALEAYAYVDQIQYLCTGALPVTHDVDEIIDLVVGVELPAGLHDGCTIQIDVQDEFVVDGDDGANPWSIEVTTTQVTLVGPDAPASLDHVVLDGDPPIDVVLTVD